jgi:hypothetical protein
MRTTPIAGGAAARARREVHCDSCGIEAMALKTCRHRIGGEQTFVLCDSCHAPIAGAVWIVPGPGAASSACRGCGGWYSLRDLAERALGGKYNAPSGICADCM